MIICPFCENQGADVGPKATKGGLAACETCGHEDEPNAFNTATNLVLTQLVVELTERVKALEAGARRNLNTRRVK